MTWKLRGVDPSKNAIHQIAILVEINGKVVEEVDLKMQPFEGAVVEDAALKVGGITRKDLARYVPQEKAYGALQRLLDKYVDRYDKLDKFHLVGFNNRYFDDRFLRAWFERNDNPYFGSHFWADSIDVMVLASQHLLHQRTTMLNFKLMTVAKTLGVHVDESKLHDGLYDVQITREAYNLITNSDLLG